MAQNPNSRANLISADMRSEEERKRLGSKGGKKSQENARKRRTFKETAEIILKMALDSEEAAKLTDIEDIQSFVEANGKNITVQEAMVFKQMQLALAGSQRSFEMMRDTVGERPIERTRDDKAALEKLDDVLKEIGGVI